MNKFESALLTVSASAFLSCSDVPNAIENKALGSTCEKVHENVMAIYAALPKEAEERAASEKSKCESLTKEDQEKLLHDSSLALQIAGARAIGVR